MTTATVATSVPSVAASAVAVSSPTSGDGSAAFAELLSKVTDAVTPTPQAGPTCDPSSVDPAPTPSLPATAPVEEPAVSTPTPITSIPSTAPAQASSAQPPTTPRSSPETAVPVDRPILHTGSVRTTHPGRSERAIEIRTTQDPEGVEPLSSPNPSVGCVMDPNTNPPAMPATDVVMVTVPPAIGSMIPIATNPVAGPEATNVAWSIRPSRAVDMSGSVPRADAAKSQQATDSGASVVVHSPAADAPIEPAAQSLFDAVVSVSVTKGDSVLAPAMPVDATTSTAVIPQPTPAVADDEVNVAAAGSPRGKDVPAHSDGDGDGDGGAPSAGVTPSVHGSEHRPSHVQTNAITVTASTGGVSDRSDAVAVAHQIGRHITASRLSAVTREHPTHLSVLLHPEDLGEVSVQLTLVAGRIDVQVSSQSDSTRDMLRQGMQDLRRQLSDSGVAVGDMDVNDGWTQQSNSSQNNPQSADQRNSQQSRLPGLPAPSSSRMTTPEPTMVHRPSRTGLDILA